MSRLVTQVTVLVAVVFTAMVLSSGWLLAPAHPASGQAVIAQATDQERVLLRHGSVSDADLRTAEGWTVACLQRQGFHVTVDSVRGITGYSHSVPLESRDHRLTDPQLGPIDGIVIGCEHRSEAVRAAYAYEHASFWDWTQPLPGVGRALRALRARS